MNSINYLFISSFKELFQSQRSPVATLSTILSLIGFGLITVGLVWFSTIEISPADALATLYISSLFLVLVGVRIGLLEIGSKAEMYMQTVNSRFWRKFFSFSWPLMIIILAFTLPLALNVAGVSWFGGLTVLNFLITEYLFLLAGVILSVVLRIITKIPILRVVLLGLLIIAISSFLRPSLITFNPDIVFGELNLRILYLLFALSSMVVLVGLIELLVGQISLRVRTVSRFLALGTATPPSGTGIGSIAYFQALKLFFRDTLIHRRLLLILLVFMMGVGLVQFYSFLFEPGQVQQIQLTLFSLFMAGGVYSLTENLFKQTDDHQSHLYDQSSQLRVTGGRFLAILSVSLIIGSFFWAVTDLQNANLPLATLGLVVFTQQLLIFGWMRKIIKATHTTVTVLLTFLLTFMVGLVPVLLWEFSPLSQIISIQLLWLILVAILLQITNFTKKHD